MGHNKSQSYCYYCTGHNIDFNPIADILMSIFTFF